MHLFKTISLFLIVTSACFACNDKNAQQPPYLEIENGTVNFLSEVSTKSVSVKTNVENWTITIQPDAQTWLSAKKQEDLLVIFATENTSDNVRQGTIILSANGISENIQVQQLGRLAAILLSSEIFTLPADGGEISLEVASNVEYQIVTPTETTWLTEKIESGTKSELVKKTYTYVVKWNPEATERRAEITVKQKNGTLEKKALVIQKPQSGYQGNNGDEIKDDIKVTVHSGTASSFQSGSEIEKSFDNDFSTIYHSAWANGGANYFPITLNYHFQDQESIDYLVYHPRGDGSSNGHFKEVEIWVSTESVPVFTKLSDYDFKGLGSATKIMFEQPLINPRTVRFIVKSGAGDGQGFVGCAEMEFYRINPDNFDPVSIFTDVTCSELKPSVTLDDIEKISNALYRNIALYMLNGKYPREFRIQEYRAWPHPDTWAKENKTSTLSLLDNPTGISVAEGEELIVFVGNTHGYTLSLKIQNLDKPGGDGYNNASFYPLSPGVNKIKARNKGLAYVFFHTSDYTSAPPVKVHFATGKVNGYFDSQRHSPSDWTTLLTNATDKYFDVLGKYAHLTFETEAFRSYVADDGPQLIAAYDDLVRLEQEFMGLEKYNRPTVNRAYFHIMYASYMYATSYRTAYESGTQKSILTLNSFKSEPWGPAHEMGHTFQTRPGFLWQGMTEVTNNMHSLYVQTQWGNPSRIEAENMGRYNNRYEKAYHSSFVNNTPHPAESDVFCKLISLWQLQLYFANARGYTDVYKDLYEMVRITPDKPNPGEQQLNFVRMMCDITKTDLTGFFTKWGYLTPFDAEVEDYSTRKLTITQDQINNLINEIKEKNYSPIAEKIEYICDSNWEFFEKKLAVETGSATKNGLNIKTNGWKNVVAYEAYDGEKLVFVTNKSSFTLDNEPVSLKVYAVAYNGNKTEVKF